MPIQHAPRRPTALEHDPVGDHEDQVRAAIEAADSDQEEETIRLGTPTLDRILVEELKVPEGVIIVPESVRRAQAKQGRVMRGRVLAMGQGLILENGAVLDVFRLFKIAIGSVVTWNEYGGRVINEKWKLHIVSTQDTLYVENSDELEEYFAGLEEEGDEAE